MFYGLHFFISYVRHFPYETNLRDLVKMSRVRHLYGVPINGGLLAVIAKLLGNNRCAQHARFSLR